ncbi:energy transducer TonB [Mesonia aquimarina]|uniref:energy transducer TonB n=1 Tax=Mesonia aquimarina TaxID=1504967 RepID=UPI000EF59EED|nr:energy transducer TonB [Mesonia aquimarina]
MKSQEQKPTLRTRFVYFQLGLIAAFLCAIFFIEHKTEVKEEVVTDVIYRQSYVEPSSNIAFKKEEPKKIEPKKDPVVKKQTKEDDDFVIDDDDLFDDKEASPESPKDDSVDKVLAGLDDPIDNDVIQPINHLIVEEAPVFPGCEIYEAKKERSQCFSTKIAKLVQRKFNHSIAEDYGLSGEQRIYVTFTVNEKGKVVNVKAVSEADVLAKEAERVARLLPDMKPGKQQGKNVPVSYSLPITFTLE